MTTKKAVTQLASRNVDLTARYTPKSGDTLLTGVQAIARLLVEQHQSDLKRGKNTANFVSGYQGSPLAGVDRLLGTMPGVLKASNTVFVPGLNEELAATSVWGSQIDLPAGTKNADGVIGYWYGKGPGLDRAADALRHANFYGTNPEGGVVLFVGDDPGSKSSTLPVVSERTIATFGIPVLFPRNAAEVVKFGLHAVALSRHSGSIVALKITNDVAEGASIVTDADCSVQAETPQTVWDGKPWEYKQHGVKLDPGVFLEVERQLHGPRTQAVKDYARANGLNVLVTNPQEAKIGIISPGLTANALQQSLADMGVSTKDVEQAGIRLLRLGLIHPIDEEEIRQFASGLQKIIVVEEKTGFVEPLIKDALYGMQNAPVIVGKNDENGMPMIPNSGELTADKLAHPLKKALAEVLPDLTPRPTMIPLPVVSTARKPYFCSGCPHNRSTVLPDGSIGGGGIGCHTMVTLEARDTTSVTGITQMGGEGAQWIGQAFFTDVPHTFQNVGDGTFFHSGQLALQACVAAGVNITYKILYNEVVAMTGAQDAEGSLPVVPLSHKLMSEGVKEIIVCSDEPEKYRGKKMAEGTLVWDRDRLEEAQLRLRDIAGVTVLIYDQHCAADARRQRKRGNMPVRNTRVIINEAVCEGCGDCGFKSNCLSVQPIETEYGQKTKIDQTSCNTDYSCLDGDCPAFMTVETDGDARLITHEIMDAPAVPNPPQLAHKTEHGVFIAGIGGTGIVTVNQILATAAFIEGFSVETLDQTGLSQKAGPVTSHLRFSRGESLLNRVSEGSADCVLAIDLLTATTPTNLAYLSPERSTVIASTSMTPTGDMVYDRSVKGAELDELLKRITPASKTVIKLDHLEAANTIIGNTENANLFVVGAALQSGSLGLSAESIEEAITLNAVAVDANIAAFRWGRFAAHDPQTFTKYATAKPATEPALVDTNEVFDLQGLREPVAQIAAQRARDLVGFQNRKTAEKYLETVREIALAETNAGLDYRFSEAVARYLFKLTAYKDEYEVARLLTKTGDTQKALADVPGGKNLTFKLHPPALRYLGRKKKIGFVPGTHGAISLLANFKGLRGTPLDVFGYARVRRVERALAEHYRELILRLSNELGSVENESAEHERLIRIASLPDVVRGYEDIKLRNVAAYASALEDEGVSALSVSALL